MSGSGAAIGEMLAKYLQKAKLHGGAALETGKIMGGALGGAAKAAIPGLVRDNAGAAMGAAGLGGLGLGIGGEELLHDDPDDIRRMEDDRLRSKAGERLRSNDPILGPLFDDETDDALARRHMQRRGGI
jgi:hypothetical protein